jgi:hypothetical protein
MKSQLNLQLRTSVYYGFLCAAACFFFTLILYFSGKNPLGKWSWLGSWIPIIFMWRGAIAHRDIDLGGSISYRQALGASYMVALSSAIMFCILVYLFGIMAGTNFSQVMISELREWIEKAKPFIGHEFYEKAKDSILEMQGNHSYTLFKMVLADFIGKATGGFIISLIVSAFIRKRIPLTANPEHS